MNADEWMNQGDTQKALQMLRKRLADAEEVLRLVAAPVRSDGTYNRCREACEELAKGYFERWK